MLLLIHRQQNRLLKQYCWVHSPPIVTIGSSIRRLQRQQGVGVPERDDIRQTARDNLNAGRGDL